MSLRAILAAKGDEVVSIDSSAEPAADDRYSGHHQCVPGAKVKSFSDIVRKPI